MIYYSKLSIKRDSYQPNPNPTQSRKKYFTLLFCSRLLYQQQILLGIFIPRRFSRNETRSLNFRAAAPSDSLL